MDVNTLAASLVIILRRPPGNIVTHSSVRPYVCVCMCVVTVVYVTTLQCCAGGFVLLKHSCYLHVNQDT